MNKKKPAKPDSKGEVVQLGKGASVPVYTRAISGIFNKPNVLPFTNDDLELEFDPKIYDKMEKDSTVLKCRKILVTNILADEMQMYPGATEETVGKEEMFYYQQMLDFSERLMKGMDRPYRVVCEQLLGNGIKNGNGIGELIWEYRMDTPNVYSEDKEKQSFFKRLFTRAEDHKNKKDFTEPRIRLMLSGIRVKPRGTVGLVVDEFMNVLGGIPKYSKKSFSVMNREDVLPRAKFIIHTMDQKDEDPRGTSSYRSSINWYNLKSQLPAEMLRYILEEITPKTIATLPEEETAYEYAFDEAGNIRTDEHGEPILMSVAESFAKAIMDLRSGSGAVIPFGSALEPYRKGLTGSNDAELFRKMIDIIDNQIEESILLQTLAQSEGEHQSRSASEQVADILYNLIFWNRWLLAVTTTKDIIHTAIRLNFGEWAIKYAPMVSFGDFVRRNWVSELGAMADAYFKGLLDDSQRPEIMALLNLPKPGISRAEQARMDVNGNPSVPPSNRPDKKEGNKNRNDGNGTEKENNE